MSAAEFGPTVGAELTEKGLLAVVCALRHGLYLVSIRMAVFDRGDFSAGFCYVQHRWIICSYKF